MNSVIGVTADTLIYVFTENPISRVGIRLEELYGRWCEGEDFKTYSYNPSTGKKELCYITNMYIGSEYQDNVLNFYLDSKCGFRCTKDAKVLMKDGSFKVAEELRVGDELGGVRNFNSKIMDIKPTSHKRIGYVVIDSDDRNFIVGEGNIILQLREINEPDEMTKFFRSIYSDFDSSDTSLINTDIDDEDDGTNVTFHFLKKGREIIRTSHIEKDKFNDMIKAIDELIKSKMK